jgi:hypothetical protein
LRPLAATIMLLRGGRLPMKCASALLLLSVAAQAQMTAKGPWPVDQVRSECIPIAESDVASTKRGCIVNARPAATASSSSVVAARSADG